LDRFHGTENLGDDLKKINFKGKLNPV